MYLRIALTKIEQRVGNGGDKGRGRGKTDADFAFFSLMQTRGAAGGLFDIQQNGARVLQKLTPGGGQLHAAVSARQQARADLLFE